MRGGVITFVTLATSKMAAMAVFPIWHQRCRSVPILTRIFALWWISLPSATLRHPPPNPASLRVTIFAGLWNFHFCGSDQDQDRPSRQDFPGSRQPLSTEQRRAESFSIAQSQDRRRIAAGSPRDPSILFFFLTNHKGILSPGFLNQDYRNLRRWIKDPSTPPPPSSPPPRHQFPIPEIIQISCPSEIWIIRTCTDQKFQPHFLL